MEWERWNGREREMGNALYTQRSHLTRLGRSHSHPAIPNQVTSNECSSCGWITTFLIETPGGKSDLVRLGYLISLNLVSKQNPKWVLMNGRPH